MTHFLRALFALIFFLVRWVCFLFCFNFFLLQMPETPVRTSQSEYKVKDPPSDGITAVKFQPGSSQFLLVSSWDCSLRLYDLNSRQIRTHFNHEEPVLDCCFSDPVRVFSGGLDHAVKGVDSNSGQGADC